MKKSLVRILILDVILILAIVLCASCAKKEEVKPESGRAPGITDSVRLTANR